MGILSRNSTLLDIIIIHEKIKNSLSDLRIKDLSIYYESLHET